MVKLNDKGKACNLRLQIVNVCCEVAKEMKATPHELLRGLREAQLALEASIKAMEVIHAGVKEIVKEEDDES